MKSPDDDILEVIQMIGLEEVPFVFEDDIEVRRKKAAGRYSPFKNKITINRKIAPFWFVTLNTLLHEYRHIMQRRIIFVSFTLFFIADLGSWAIDRLVYMNVLFGVIIPVTSGLVMVYAIYYFEGDARRYARGRFSEVVLFLTALELSILAHEVQAGKRTVCSNLEELHILMMEDFPSFL